MNDFDYLAASNGSGEAVRATATSERPIGATSISVDALTNWPEKFVAMSGTVSPDTGKFVPGSTTVFRGSRDLSSTTPAIHVDSLAPGYFDQGNQAGQVVVLKPTTEHTDIVARAMRELMEGVAPTGSRQEYFGTKATFDISPYRHGWLFMEKNTAYQKSEYQRLYDHLKAVDSASVKTDTGATFMFADKWFGRTAVSGDSSQTEFNALGKAGGHKALQAHTHSNGSLTAASAGAHTHGMRHLGSTSGGTLGWAGNSGTTSNTGTLSAGAHTHNVTGTTSSTGGGDSENLSPYITMNYIIKT